jgi:hypothetical protein
MQLHPAIDNGVVLLDFVNRCAHQIGPPPSNEEIATMCDGLESALTGITVQWAERTLGPTSASDLAELVRDNQHTGQSAVDLVLHFLPRVGASPADVQAICRRLEQAASAQEPAIQRMFRGDFG